MKIGSLLITDFVRSNEFIRLKSFTKSSLSHVGSLVIAAWKYLVLANLWSTNELGNSESGNLGFQIFWKR